MYVFNTISLTKIGRAHWESNNNIMSSNNRNTLNLSNMTKDLRRGDRYLLVAPHTSIKKNKPQKNTFFTYKNHSPP
jgi:hypothetical protein